MITPASEKGIDLQPVPDGIQVLVGDQVAGHDSRQLGSWTSQVHDALGNNPYIYQPEEKDIRAGMEGGDFVLAVDENTGLVVATSHLRVAKKDPSWRELGGVVKVDRQAPIGATVVVKQGVDLGRHVQGAEGVELLVANENFGGQIFFRRLEGIQRSGERPSNYLKDAKGIPLQMTVFDATKLTGRKLPRGRGV